MVALRRAPPPLPPPWYPVMYSCASISNGSHGVFSPPPSVEQDIPPAVLCGFPTVRAGQGGRRIPLPPVEQDGFPFCHTHTQTHTHTPGLCECRPFYLPTPLLWNRMVFPFALRHTHTQRVCPFHSLVCGILVLRTSSPVACLLCLLS